MKKRKWGLMRGGGGRMEGRACKSPKRRDWTRLYKEECLFGCRMRAGGEEALRPGPAEVSTRLRIQGGGKLGATTHHEDGQGC